MPTRTCGDVEGARLRVGIFALLLGGFGLPPALAQDSDAVTVDVGRCTGLESADARLACFGEQVNAVLQERGSTDADEPAALTQDVVDADPAASGRDERSSDEEQPTERAAIGGSGDDLRSETAVAETQVYSGSIVSIRERLPSAYVITLDNGQVWEQTQPKQYPLRPGLEVRIYPTRWGSYYRLSGLGSGSHIQVRKVE